MKKNLAIFLLFIPFLTFSQVVDDFSDGDFTQNPTWSGTDADFIVNSNQQLQTDASIATTSYLTTPNQLTSIDDVEWNFYLKQSFAGSGSNYTKIFLTADNSDLNNVQNGYYLLFGEAGSNDAIRLFKLTSGSSSEIMAGTAGAIASSFAVSVRILHKNNGDWELYADYSGGQNYVLEATANDLNTTAEPYFGISCVYTVSNIKKIYLDDIYIGNIVVDDVAPTIANVDVIDNQNITVEFSEAIDPLITNQTLAITPSLTVNTISMLTSSKIQIAFNETFINSELYQVTIPSVQDLEGNDTTLTFDFKYLVAETPNEGDVIISEFMSDPTPVIGLPDAEYVEIYNRSSKIFNVKDWKINNNSSSGKLKEAWLMPGQYLVVTSTTNEALFTESIGATSFPSLKNAGDDIVLTDENDQILDQLTYDLSWFDDASKKDGGWSLERIKLHINCSDKFNWKASVNELGGTPGSVNSVNDATPDTEGPDIENIMVLSDTALAIVMNEPLNENWNTMIVSISPTVAFASPAIERDSASLSKFYIYFSEPLQPSKEYQLTFDNITDCQGNTTTETSIYVTIPAIPQKGELIVNEILFNPITGGADFIEIKNISNNVFNLLDLQLTNTKTGNSNNATITTSYLIYPQELVVLTPDSTFQKETYPFHGSGNFIQMGIPAMANKESTIVLMQDSTVIDSLTYHEKWHFQLLSDFKGKSLERINDEANSSESSSWHTASEYVSFATPGIENSQNTSFLHHGELSLSSETFSPDNDGFEDFLTILYEMDDIGYVGSVNIYDDRGRLIRKLINNELLGVRGSFTWDGINDAGQKAHVGTYVIVFEGYQVEVGKIFKLKKVAVLAGDL